MSPTLELGACMDADGAAVEPALRVELHAEPASAGCAARRGCSRAATTSRGVWTHLERAGVRRPLHGAAPRLRATRRTTTTGPRRMRVVDRIRVPALVITAEDDPFIAAAAVPRPDGHRATPRSRWSSRVTAGTAGSSRRARDGVTTATGPSARSSTSSAQPRRRRALLATAAGATEWKRMRRVIR
ncbi:MAG: hypothetical protein M0C28_16435 [Candidatus Moduliflexus flocculans]|nr:hypothetical protein [Candidatus Moduliflexus flocculans]